MDLAVFGPYIATILAYFIIFNILTWGLNIQFGYAGIPNFTYITFMAMGAYVTGATGLPRPTAGFQYVQYILGYSWPFPITLLAGAVGAGALAFLLGLITLRRLRTDYLAIVTFSLGFILYDVVGTFVPLFNGFDGLFGVPQPLADVFQLDPNTYPYFFIPLSLVIMLICWLVANRIFDSPLGRTMRAIREDVEVAEALGKDSFRFRIIALIVGCVFAGVAGGLTIEFVTAFNPSGWTAPETFVIFAACLVGGKANNRGAVLGAFLVPVIFFEGSRFIPVPPDHPLLLAGIRYMVIGTLLIGVLWFRPEGLLPEKKKAFFEIALKKPTLPVVQAPDAL
ncbi:MAG: branched-chain amino acid transport system permease protein [Chloroflexota bacterium]|jgi:ABC-type branched-subunit amino acid transport system permease subunit|nr:branched-chain amino acid transport system permease protein [Chloroflexota bacterium]